jgi:hypothetical protein
VIEVVEALYKGKWCKVAAEAGDYVYLYLEHGHLGGLIHPVLRVPRNEVSFLKVRIGGFGPIVKNMKPLDGPAQVYAEPGATQSMRTFETGATRDTDENKLDYDGFLSPRVLKRYAEYMHRHRRQPDGKLRDSDNWQKGIPLDAYRKSAWRHFMDVWTLARSELTVAGRLDLEEAICALLFNLMGYLHELLGPQAAPPTDPIEAAARELDKLEPEDFAPPYSGCGGPSIGL